jgi:signal transduction histidine kinase
MHNPFKGSLKIDFYTNQSKIKWFILLVAIIIGTGSIVYTNELVDRLKKGEEEKIKLWAEAVEFSGSSLVDESALTFISSNIITPDNTLPVILVDSASQEILLSRNVVDSTASIDKRERQLEKTLEKMKRENEPFPIMVRNATDGSLADIQYVYYRNSYILRQLRAYPYIQLSVIAIFAFIAYLAFSYSRRAEQNRVWVGMAKETAHQLGTPLSSLMAWLEYLKAMPELKDKQELVQELDKDVERLERITARFSNIGSLPVLKSEPVEQVIDHCLAYLKPRLSSKVHMSIEAKEPNLMAQINKPLFEWVVENIVKNGVDAMSGIGQIKVVIGRDSTHEVFVDISDNGKGIPKSKLNDVFKPGYTTKKRGWGLGLALARRIIENYHQGKIFVKSSQIDIGTTFRILLRA